MKPPSMKMENKGPSPREMAAKALLRAIEDKDYPAFLRMLDDIMDMRDESEDSEAEDD